MTVGNSTGRADSEIWADCTFWHKPGIWRNFAITSPETLNTKIAFNEFSFLLVTHTVYSDARFDSYEILKLGQGCENYPDKLDIQMNDQVLHAQDAWNLARVVYDFRRPLTQLSNAYSYTCFWLPQQQLQPFEYSPRAKLVDCCKTEL
jgi:hypothetical protein